MLAPYSNLIIWLVIFFSAHSILASGYLKKIINKRRPFYKSYYRLFFNLVSIALLVPIIFYYVNTRTVIIFQATIVTQAIGSTLALAGLYIVFAGFKNYRTDEFIGTYQIKNNHEFHPTRLNRSGWNAVVRHPLYFGGILLAIGLCLFNPIYKLLVTISLIITYLVFGTIWEEKKLMSEFGEVYKKYQREVSMLIPILWVLNKFRHR